MTAHAAASTEDNALKLWNPLPGSPDADLLPERGTLVGRGRDLERNHGVAAGARQSIVDNVVGTGLRLSARPMYKLLGREKAWAQEFSRTAQDWFALWGGDTACDAADERDFAAQTAQVCASLWVNGEACALPLWMPEPDCVFATKLLLLEPDHLCNPRGQIDSPSLRDGVRLDERTGRALGYHVRRSHPGDAMGLRHWAQTGEWEYIPARTPWGRRRFIHLKDQTRIGQSRGKSVLAGVIKPFKMADHYLTTELQAAIVNAMIAAFIKSPLDQESLVELFGGSLEGARAYMEERDRQNTVKLKGGAVIPLAPGDELQAFTPARPAAGFDAFMTSIYRQIAAGLNIPYELLLKDFSRTNYSSARAAMLEAWRYFNGLRKRVATGFCQEAYLLVLEEMVDRGMVDAPDYYPLQRAYAASRWIGPGRGWVDPVKEAEAAKVRMDSGLSTLEMECAEQGLDWEEVLEQQAVEQARRKELGLTPAAAPAGPRAPYPSDVPEDGGDGTGTEPDNATDPAAPADAGA